MPVVPFHHSQRGAIRMGKVCDFCSDATCVWEFPCADYYDEEIKAGSAGAWAACETCAKLVRTNQWTQLAKQALRCPSVKYGMIPDMGPGAEEILIASAARRHRLFRKHMIGTGQRVMMQPRACDFCGSKEYDRVWLWRVRGFGFRPRIGLPMENPPGWWGTCVMCRPLFEQGDVPTLVARVQSLNPEPTEARMADAKVYYTDLFNALLLARYGDPIERDTSTPFIAEGEFEINPIPS